MVLFNLKRLALFLLVYNVSYGQPCGLIFMKFDDLVRNSVEVSFISHRFKNVNMVFNCKKNTVDTIKLLTFLRRNLMKFS